VPRPCLVPVCLPYNPSRKSLGRSGLVRRYGVVLLLVYSGINSKANIYRTLAKRPRALSVGVCGTGRGGSRSGGAVAALADRAQGEGRGVRVPYDATVGPTVDGGARVLLFI